MRVIVENFERLPAHDETGGIELYDGGACKSDVVEVEVEVDAGEGVEASTTYSPANVDTSDPGDTAGMSGSGSIAGEVRESEDGETRMRERDRPRLRTESKAIPAKFLQAISAGLSIDLDPKVCYRIWAGGGGVLNYCLP